MNGALLYTVIIATCLIALFIAVFLSDEIKRRHWRKSKRYGRVFETWNEYLRIADHEGMLLYAETPHFEKDEYEKAMSKYSIPQSEPELLIDLWIYTYGSGENDRGSREYDQKLRAYAAKRLYCRGSSFYPFNGKIITREELSEYIYLHDEVH